MTWTESMKQELTQARRELMAAEEELKTGTPAAHTRYVRALHEAELAEQRADRAARDPQWRTWH